MKHMAGCHKRLSWTMDNNWKGKIFSDETKVVVGTDNKVKIWGTDNGKWLLQCFGASKPWASLQSICHVLGMYMVWWSDTCSCPWQYKSTKNVDILDQNLWLVVAKCFVNFSWTFQYENVPPHRTHYTTQWERRNEIPTMLWLA